MPATTSRRAGFAGDGIRARGSGCRKRCSSASHARAWGAPPRQGLSIGEAKTKSCLQAWTSQSTRPEPLAPCRICRAAARPCASQQSVPAFDFLPRTPHCVKEWRLCDCCVGGSLSLLDYLCFCALMFLQVPILKPSPSKLRRRCDQFRVAFLLWLKKVCGRCFVEGPAGLTLGISCNEDLTPYSTH